MAKKGDLKPMDEFEETVRANAKYYNVVLFTPGSSSRVYHTVDTLDEAKDFSFGVFDDQPRCRAAMVYAVDEDERFALVGTVNRGGKWKQATVKRY